MKQTESTLSLACMINVAVPRPTQGRMSRGLCRKFCTRSFRTLFLLNRNSTTHRHDTPCETMVASAAPRTPMPSLKIRIGSSTILHTAPISTVSIPSRAKPWAVMNAFMPSVSWTKTVPMA